MNRALFLIVLSLTASAGAQPAEKPKLIQLASPGLSGAGLEKSKTEFYSGHLAQQLSLQPDIRCMTASEIESLLGMERQRTLLGCDTSENSCVAELANALGVDGLVTGSIGLVGRVHQINVRILSARDGAQLAAVSATVESEEAMLKSLNAAAGQLASQLRRSLGRAEVAIEQPTNLRRFAWIPAATGVMAAAAGGFFLFRSEDAGNRLRAPADDPRSPPTEPEAAALRDSGARDQTFARVSFAIAAASIGTAAIFYALGTDAAPSISVAPGEVSAGISFRF